MHDLVIFDCDGVLVDSETTVQLVMVERLAPFGLSITPQKSAELFVGGTMISAAEEATRLGARLPDNWVQETYSAMFDALRNNTPPIENVIPLLNRLDESGLPYCVASNGPMSKMEITLAQNDLWDRFEGRRWSAHDVGKAKPDPGLFLHAAHSLGADPSGCVVIEDSPSGVTAAIRAEMRCLAYAPLGSGEKLADLGAEVFTDMDEVPALLGI